MSLGEQWLRKPNSLSSKFKQDVNVISSNEFYAGLNNDDQLDEDEDNDRVRTFEKSLRANAEHYDGHSKRRGLHY